MADLILSAIIVFLFAWVARALLDARELTWGRTTLAAVAGILFGQAVAAVILVQDIRDTADLDTGQLLTLSLPFSLVGTMGAMLVLELLFSSAGTRRGLGPVRPLRALRHRVGVTMRGWRVSRIAVRHGLAPLLGLRRQEVSTRSPEELARRTRLALEEAGGMFVKLGQLLATRPDLVPPEALAELGRLHAAAAPLPREQVEQVLREETGRPLEELFAEIDWTPLGSASIAQVHAARLSDGREVVLKVRRPGLEAQVEKDLAIALWLAGIAERRTEWGKSIGVRDLADEFADALRAELDFQVEARHATESRIAMAQHPEVRVPEIFSSMTTESILVMERLEGVPVSNLTDERDRDHLGSSADVLCRSQVEAMLNGERFHGDPHPGNVLILDDGTLGLIDFGITGRLDAFERGAVLQMLVAIWLEQPSLLYESMVSIGAVGPADDPDRIERALAQFMAAHLGPGLPSLEALTDLVRVTIGLGVKLPPSTTTMFRALATLAGTLETLSPGYPLIEVVADLGGTELRQQMVPESPTEFIEQEWAQLGPLLRRAPRHFDRVASQLEHGRLTTRLRLFTEPDDVRVLERLLNRVVLTGLAIGTGVVSVLMLDTEAGPMITVLGVRFLEALGWTGMTLAIILLLRVLLAVLRSDRRPGAG